MAETTDIGSPLQGTIVEVSTADGQVVSAGATLIIIESMKMEHLIEAPGDGTVSAVHVATGDTVMPGDLLISFTAAATVDEPAAAPTQAAAASAAVQEATPVAPATTPRTQAADASVRADLAEVIERHGVGLDDARPDAVAKRRSRNQRTARENVEHLVDADSFVEYAPLVIAAQRRRRELDDLIARTPADGLVSGIGSINGDLFGPDNSQCAVLAYDYTVLAGTQGQQNHRKKDRMFEIAEQQQLPVIFFTEGGGGRPGDTDGLGIAGLDCWAFAYWGALSGLVPMIGINSGYCFAGNAAILACCDVIIATEDSNIGMAGPAMIEGGGLGVYAPTEIGPIDVQTANGVVDIAVADEAEAVEVAKQYLSYFQGQVTDWEAPDPTGLRDVVPENRVRVYEIRDAIEGLADVGSVLELRSGWAPGMVTCLARIEGRPLGVIANNPKHLGGAVDPDAADKSARFMQLCDAHDLPIVFLCDTPGFMVGPEAEEAAMVRRAGRLFVVGASLDVPVCTIITRKGYGLGAQAMAAGSFKKPIFTVAWPTGEIGGMGLEGYVQLGFRKELEAEPEGPERDALYQKLVDRMYEKGKAVSAASHFEIDDVIDPADSRKWILTALRSAPERGRRIGKKRPHVDAW